MRDQLLRTILLLFITLIAIGGNIILASPQEPVKEIPEGAEDPPLNFIGPKSIRIKAPVVAEEDKFDNIINARFSTIWGFTAGGLCDRDVWEYELVDGGKVKSIAFYYGSEKSAKMEFDAKLKDAKKVLSRTNVLDDNGKILGERVLAITNKDHGVSYFMVVATRNKKCYLVTAPLKEVVLKEEQSLIRKLNNLQE